MAYFHTTPMGRIINRLTKDTADVDKNLADFSAFYIRSFLQLLSTIVVIGATVPFALPAIVPILLLFYFLYQYFQVLRLCACQPLSDHCSTCAAPEAQVHLCPLEQQRQAATHSEQCAAEH